MRTQGCLKLSMTFRYVRFENVKQLCNDKFDSELKLTATFKDFLLCFLIMNCHECNDSEDPFVNDFIESSIGLLNQVTYLINRTSKIRCLH